MFLILPLELRELIVRYLDRRQYKASVPCKALLVCKSYLSIIAYCRSNSFPIIKLSNKEKQSLFIASCCYNNLALAKRLLKCETVQPSVSAEDNRAIREASKYGCKDIVEFLLKDPRVDPSARYNSPICQASSNGHKEIVEMLLRDARVDPSDNHNYAIQWASRKGFKEIVEMLLKDVRVDPTEGDNYAIRSASRNGHRKVVEILLKDMRVDPSAKNEEAIREASRNGHRKVVEILLKDPRVNPLSIEEDIQTPNEERNSDRDFYLSRWFEAHHNGNPKILKYLSNC